MPFGKPGFTPADSFPLFFSPRSAPLRLLFLGLKFDLTKIIRTLVGGSGGGGSPPPTDLSRQVVAWPGHR